MKKIKIVLIMFCFLFIVGCGDSVKEVGSLDKFQEVASENELIVEDNMANYTADYIKEAMVALNDDLSIEMIVYTDEDNASNVQDSQINTFMNMKSTSGVTKKFNGNNYYKFTMISNGYYLVSSRIDNTLIFTKTLLKNKDTVDNILEAMGY